MMKRATITDVARHVGVSPTAVSFAFNNPSQLNQQTVEQILNAARELGYAPNPHARALLTRRTGVLGVLVPQALFAIYANPFFATFLQGIGDLCDEQSLGMLTVSPLEGSLTNAITRAPVDGFIIVGLNQAHAEVAPLVKRRVPFVIVDADATTAPSVNVDDEGGAYLAARYLLDQGHRDILIFSFEPAPDNEKYGRPSVGNRRLRGYRRAFEESGADWGRTHIVPLVSGVEDGQHAFGQVWDAGKRPTALLAMSDVTAVGAVRAAQARQLRLPHDFEVIGYDDIPLATLISPTLSTIHQPIFEKGRTAAEILFSILEGAKPVDPVFLPTELLLRETTNRLIDSR